MRVYILLLLFINFTNIEPCLAELLDGTYPANCTALFYVPRDKLTIGFKGYNLKFEELHPRPLLSIRQNEGLV